MAKTSRIPIHAGRQPPEQNLGGCTGCDSHHGLRIGRTAPSSLKRWTLAQRREYTLYYYYDAAGKLRQIGYKAGSGHGDLLLRGPERPGGISSLCTAAPPGTLVGTYTYDAWGKVIGITTSTDPNGLMTKNPFRYRGLLLRPGNRVLLPPVSLLQPGDPQVPECG